MPTLTDILERIVQPERGDFSTRLAQHVIGIKFTDDELARYEALAGRPATELSHLEAEELQALITAKSFLDLLQRKARRSLSLV